MSTARRTWQPMRVLWWLQRRSGWIKVLALLGVHALAATALTRVTTTAGPPMGVLDAGYEALQFFLIAGYRPVEGPVLWRGLTWVALFTAPVVAGGFLLDRLVALSWSLVGSPPAMLRLRGHAVVCGFGTQGEGIANALAEAGYTVVALDSKNRSTGRWLELGDGTVAPLIVGDMLDGNRLRLAGADRAGVVVFATRDGMTNLRAAIDLQRLQNQRPSFWSAQSRLYVLVDDTEPFEEVVASLNEAVTAGGTIVLVSRYDMAGDLANRYLEAHTTIDRAVVVGLGRFGRKLTARLLAAGADVTVVERDLDRCLQDAGIARSAVQLVQEDAVRWAKGLPHGLDLDVAFVCLDDDVANLQVGHLLSKRVGDGRAVIVLRAVDPALKRIEAPHLHIEHTTALVAGWFSKRFLRG